MFESAATFGSFRQAFTGLPTAAPAHTGRAPPADAKIDFPSFESHRLDLEIKGDFGKLF
jgi:hypothetical protein